METTSEQLESQMLNQPSEPDRNVYIGWKLVPSVNRQAVKAGREDGALALRRRVLRLLIAIFLNGLALHILLHATQPPYSAKIYVAERKVLIYAGAANIVPQCLNLLFVLAAMTNR